MADRSDIDGSSSSCFSRDSNYILEDNELKALAQINEEDNESLQKSEEEIILKAVPPQSRNPEMTKVV